MLQTLLSIIHVTVCLFLILVVLLQQGRGGGMGSAFGGATAQVFGGRGAGNFLTRLTGICAAIFMLGLLSDYYFGRNTEHLALFSILYAAAPNFQFFWIGDYITQEITVSASHVLNVLAYGTLYTLAVLGLGITMFQTREVG